MKNYYARKGSASASATAATTSLANTVVSVPSALNRQLRTNTKITEDVTTETFP